MQSRAADFIVKNFQGNILLLSQFTLMASFKKNKPNFSKAAKTEIAKEIYYKIVEEVKEKSNYKVLNGQFKTLYHINQKFTNSFPEVYII
ncbi:hypothetical protein NUSPORA_01977 [Nucleospora cyclopteri]